MNILKQELRMSFRSWIYFTVAILALLLLFAFFFGALREDAALLNQLLENFPKEFKAAFGFADVNLGELEGYTSFLMSYVVLIGAVFGMKLGVQLLSEEYRAKTSDFLLTRPVKRIQVVGAKFTAIMILLITQNLLLFGFGLAGIKMIVGESIDPLIYALLSFSTLLVQLFFVGIGMALAAAIQRIKSVMAITLGVVFFFFIIEMLNQSLLEKGLTYLTPFSYFKGSAILASRGYESSYLIVDLAVFVVFTIIACVVYQKRDVHSL